MVAVQREPAAALLPLPPLSHLLPQGRCCKNRTVIFLVSCFLKCQQRQEIGRRCKLVEYRRTATVLEIYKIKTAILKFIKKMHTWMINYIDTRKFVEKNLTTYFLWRKKTSIISQSFSLWLINEHCVNCQHCPWSTRIYIFSLILKMHKCIFLKWGLAKPNLT